MIARVHRRVGVRRDAAATSRARSPNLQPTFASIRTEISRDDRSRRAARRASPATPIRDACRPATLNLRDRSVRGARQRARSRRSRRRLVDARRSRDELPDPQARGPHDITGLRMPLNGPPYLTDGQIARDPPLDRESALPTTEAYMTVSSRRHSLPRRSLPLARSRPRRASPRRSRPIRRQRQPAGRADSRRAIAPSIRRSPTSR